MKASQIRRLPLSGSRYGKEGDWQKDIEKMKRLVPTFFQIVQLGWLEVQTDDGQIVTVLAPRFIRALMVEAHCRASHEKKMPTLNLTL